MTAVPHPTSAPGLHPDKLEVSAALLAALESKPHAPAPEPLTLWDEDSSYFMPERCTPLDDF